MATTIRSLTVSVLCKKSPDFSWIEDDMFVYEVFPRDISYNSIGATKFATDVIVTDSGDDQRLSRWQQPLMEYDVAYGVRTMEDLHALVAFFRAVMGRKHGFLYKDPMDHTSTLAVATEAREAPDISPTDQIIGSGGRVGNSYQLVKLYKTAGGSLSFSRKITKPNVGSVRLALDGNEISNFSVDKTTGIVILTPPVTITVPATYTLVRPGYGCIKTTASFTGLNVNDLIYMSGWPTNAPTNNVDMVNSLRITSMPNDKTIYVSTPSWYGANASTAAAVITAGFVNTSGVDSEVTAGYEFFVPVRFDTDRLPMTLQDYGVGGANEVKLVEIRQGETL